jgi:2-methylcitrate dehydratase PrpD
VLTRKQFLQAASCGAASMVAGALNAAGVDEAGGGAKAPAARQGPAAAKGPTKAVTAAVVKFVTTARIEQFPGKVIAEAKRCLIDGFGVMLGGATVRGSTIVRKYLRAVGGRREASVLGPERLKAPLALAALANGASGHAMDWDDTQLSASPDRVYGLLTHPTVPALAGALAVAERLNASGLRFLEAFLTGFEVECKIAEAIRPEHYNRGFHTSGTIGTFGAMVAAAKLLNLDSSKLAHSLGIASSMGSGIRVNFGSMTKPLHVGRAAENGIVAVDLASRGFTAGDDALDGQWGFLQVLGGGADEEKIVGVLGNPYTIADPGVSVKPYPCGVLGHPSMDAMLKLVTDHDIRPDQVARIRLRAGSNILNPLRYRTARTELEAKFCPAFMLSAIVLRRKAGVHEFADEFVSSEPVQQMMRLVETVLDQDVEAKGFDRIRSVVEVELKDGRKLLQAGDERYRGGPERPFTRDELHAKFTENAELFLTKDAIRRSLELIESVDELRSVRELIEAMSPPGTHQS